MHYGRLCGYILSPKCTCTRSLVLDVGVSGEMVEVELEGGNIEG